MYACVNAYDINGAFILSIRYQYQVFGRSTPQSVIQQDVGKGLEILN